MRRSRPVQVGQSVVSLSLSCALYVGYAVDRVKPTSALFRVENALFSVEPAKSLFLNDFLSSASVKVTRR